MSISSKEKTTLAAPSLHKQVIPNKAFLQHCQNLAQYWTYVHNELVVCLKVLISTTYTELCATLQQLFSIVDMPFILFKNIVRNGPQGTRSFRPSQSTFIEELNDQCTKAHLETLAKCNIQVVGVLKAKNAYFPPYEISCSMCHHSLPFDAAIDMDFVHCTYCNTDTQTSCHHNILCTLNTQEGNIDCSLQGDILQQTYPDITRYNIRTIPTKHLANGLYVAQAPPLWHVHISCEQHHY
ncbi:uncharacterized protein LOC131049705 isoform X4 [Cryptomeria japonica]|nr:uncharacterized protein LOC131049705 isoform X4 [Cryptomeria japonica]XP_059073736.1 uncharacterized protein LOC131049705 isoform X4 [Cryptomeria japonica]XP_059073738.1 uncharacterized protein LOC131049705 isoform X4 [Cryptomeria japonica]XP_059073743.1 uncharacterized protein LOC131049705 isoform X4 [Cryptomeria japonica]